MTMMTGKGSCQTEAARDPAQFKDWHKVIRSYIFSIRFLIVIHETPGVDSLYGLRLGAFG